MGINKWVRSTQAPSAAYWACKACEPTEQETEAAAAKSAWALRGTKIQRSRGQPPCYVSTLRHLLPIQRV